MLLCGFASGFVVWSLSKVMTTSRPANDAAGRRSAFAAHTDVALLFALNLPVPNATDATRDTFLVGL